MEDRFQVKRYSSFPRRKEEDKIMFSFSTLEQAQFESMYLNKMAKFGDRYYVKDLQHTPLSFKKSEVKMLTTDYNLQYRQ